MARKPKNKKVNAKSIPIVSQPKVSISVDLMQEILNFLNAGKVWMNTGPTLVKIVSELGLTPGAKNDPKHP